MFALNLSFSSTSHVIKGQALISSLVVELLNVNNYNDALTYLKSRSILSTNSADIEDVEISIKNFYIKTIQKLSGYTSTDRTIKKDFVDLYNFRILVNEFKSIISSIYNSTPINEKLGQFDVFSNLVKQKVNSLEEAKNLITEDHFRNALEQAVSSGKNLKNILNSIDLYFAKYLHQILLKNNESWANRLWSIYCGYFDYYSIIMALELKTRESFELTCNIPEEYLENLRNNEDVVGNLIRISTLLGLDIKSDNVAEILEAIRIMTRRIARKNSYEMFLKELPSSPNLLISVLELLYLDLTDVIRILNSLYLKKNQEYLKKIVSV